MLLFFNFISREFSHSFTHDRRVNELTWFDSDFSFIAFNFFLFFFLFWHLALSCVVVELNDFIQIFFGEVTLMSQQSHIFSVPTWIGLSQVFFFFCF
jgi:hypothetical protein